MAWSDGHTVNFARSHSKKPGKTAPYFLEALFRYSLLQPQAGGYNVLTDFPKQNGNGVLANTASCSHVFQLKPKQSVLPSNDALTDVSTRYIFAAICARCRTHAEVDIDFQDSKRREPCPREGNPLHHFVHVDSIQPRRESAASRNREDWREVHVFACSSSACPARLNVRLKLPMLNDEAVKLLTDQETLKLRQDVAYQQEPDRLQGVPRAKPVDVLNDLRIYINNSWTKKSPIQLINKRFMARFGLNGAPCKSLLEFVGFTYKPDQCWIPPQPPQNAATPYQDTLSRKLDDIETELMVLILARPYEEQKSITIDFSLEPALPQLKATLGCQNYAKSTQRNIGTQDELWHNILGVPLDAADELVVFAYQRQCEQDEEQVHWYLTHLHRVANQRNSEMLTTLVATEKSAGRYDTYELQEAYHYLGIELSNRLPEENYVIGTFNSRLENTAPQHQPALRRCLAIIGDHMNSSKVLAVAADTLDTYEQALSYLNAEPTLGDEFIETLYTAKIAEHPDQEEKARKAVTIIAQARNSKALFAWLDTGRLGEIAMDAGEAYQLLGIDDRTTEDSLIEAVFQVRVSENPSALDTYQKALRTIAEDRNSVTLLQLVGLTQPGAASSEWPVGLHNIGNTCYLNSLLQFFFTVSGLRNTVLDFEDVKMDLSEESLLKKQISARRVNLKEIQRSQNFVHELKKLFGDMIQSPEASVTPDLQLARLALVSSKNEDVIRRKSTLSGKRPTLGELNGIAVQGPVGPPENQLSQEPIAESPAEVEESHTQIHQSQPEEQFGALDDPSKILPGSAEDAIMADADVQEQQQILNNKENLPPQKSTATIETQVSSQDVVMLLRESSPARINSQAGESTPSASATQLEDLESKGHVSTPPNRPPPVPPRPILLPTPDPESLKREVELGAQHDVSEVIENFLFQLSCAIKPTSIDQDGEQSDQIRQLFWGRQRGTIISPDGESRHMDFIFSDTKVVPVSESQDVYSVLDGAFDIETIELDAKAQQRYTSLVQAPPILQVNIQRAQWDRGKGDRVKNNNHVKLPETIYLDRYFGDEAGHGELLDRRKQSWEWKQELRQLESRRRELNRVQNGVDAPTALRTALGLMESVREDDAINKNEVVDDFGAPLSTLKTLGRLADQAQNELTELELRIRDISTKIDSQFIDLRQHPYRIHSLYFHRGRTSSGHYWIYIRDFEKDVWRKYNDSYVTQVEDLTEIFSDPRPRLQRGEDPANPYIVVYVRDPGLIKSVCRDINESAGRQAEDVVMVDDPVKNNNEGPSIQHLSIAGASSAAPPSGQWGHSEASLPGVRW